MHLISVLLQLATAATMLKKKNHTMGPRVVGPTITCGTLTNFVGVASDNDPQPAHRCAFA
jgi:hypothetical protein